MINQQTIDVGDVVLAQFPYEDNPNMMKLRPAVVIGIQNNNLTVVALKITSTPPRDKFDYELVNWALAGLKDVSTVRTSKNAIIVIQAIVRKIGSLTQSDFQEVMRLYNMNLSRINSAKL